MDRNVDVRTPESIAFAYELAGVGSRFLALAIDQLVQIALLAAIVFAVVGLAARTPAARVAALPGGEEKVAGAIAVALVVIVVFTIFFGYFIIFETAWNGQTPGKKALGIRVVRDGGFPVDFGAALIRNVVRIGELIVGYYALSVASMLLSAENKRLGDLAAGTIVVRDARLSYSPRPGGPEFAPVYAPTLYLSGDERALVKRFLERRDALDAANRRALAQKLAARVRDRVPPELRTLDDESLLERL